MKPPSRNWPPSPPPSHSTEIEHRLTAIEIIQDERLTVNDERRQKVDSDLRSILSRLSWHERAILVMGGILQILMQDKYPLLAEVLKRALHP